MSPSHALAFVALVAASTLAGASRADEPAAQKVVLRDRWKAGDVAKYSANEKRVKSIVRYVKDKPSENADDSFHETRVVDQEVVVSCVEASPEGTPTKRLLWFAKFLYSTNGESGAQKDASLENVFVEVDGVGAARTLTIRSPDAKVSPRAMRWLEAEHGRGEHLDALLLALEPKEPAVVGATWKPAGDAIAGALDSEDAPIDAENSSAEATLAALDGTKADYHLVVLAASKGRMIDKKLVPWKTGGTGRLELRATRGLAADAFDATGETEDVFEGATAEKGGETRVSVKSSVEWVWEKGGTMPPIPPPGAPKSEPKPDAAPPAPPDAPKPDAPPPGK